MTRKKIALTVLLPPDVHSRLKQVASHTGNSLAGCIRSGILAEVERLETHARRRYAQEQESREARMLAELAVANAHAQADRGEA
jgi:predicted DNA-binding protein